MKIEIWSDIVCPFCFIGKRKLEKSLQKFGNRDAVEIEWKSFLLNPDLQTDPSATSLEHLSKTKGWSLEQTLQITTQVEEMAKLEGLEYNLQNARVANSKNAHRLLQFAKVHGKGDAMKERLLKAHLSESRNIDYFETLISLGKEVGLDEENIKSILYSKEFENAVDQDMYEAHLIGVRGVPFFVFDRKFAISGAQADEVFDRTLEQAWNEFSLSKEGSLKVTEGEEGESCTDDGNCG
ncbi:DsbA family oxidoreductase [Algoriphagus sp. CAU 1675]|uniref:DsbA family oxidoreductase n=1 Tax=Algoriphagus sp. CAU 1675 TaxID=3032597 RepID=UPI0023DC9D9D|nr:DsbA family oxidoreductase [Algoriphagus sp. CAU 1675]MDF2157976.1 DsbA family oxidoreductase [Algoriphagus sp. CAU 1675]